MRARQETSGQIPLFEWIAAALGLALVATTLIFLAYQALTQDDAPPAITLQAESVEAVPSGYLVRIRALNTGGRTAAQVRIEGRLKGLLGTVERSETTFDYLPPHSPRRGGLWFATDPRKFELELQAQGYQAP